MQKKVSKKIIIIGILIIAIFSLSIIQIKQQEMISVSASQISNKKIGWGIKRNDEHKQPDVGAMNQNVLEENNGICLGNKEKKYIYLTFDEGYEAGYTT